MTRRHSTGRHRDTARPAKSGSLAASLALLAILVNLFGWLALPATAQASGIRGDVAVLQSDICHSADPADLPSQPKGKPFCIQCFPLLSAASGAMAPAQPELPLPSSPASEKFQAIGHIPAVPADSVVYPARAPPVQA
ncbi:MAG TPA: hypothetical protein VM661_00330 [Candidatus Sulfotelmatobacter sp.]|jgi:hypothetical protein|nr:hypothetical protein [Candidatus Sulfotelmatobacter sp.]